MDRNKTQSGLAPTCTESHSLRSAWIEILLRTRKPAQASVALLTECVDRNQIPRRLLCMRKPVALLTECVDRNYHDVFRPVERYTVALLTECVDRNISAPYLIAHSTPSHSLRSAWIEIALKQQVKK